jgi:hypothetical protein
MMMIPSGQGRAWLTYQGRQVKDEDPMRGPRNHRKKQEHAFYTIREICKSLAEPCIWR